MDLLSFTCETCGKTSKGLSIGADMGWSAPSHCSECMVRAKGQMVTSTIATWILGGILGGILVVLAIACAFKK